MSAAPCAIADCRFPTPHSPLAIRFPPGGSADCLAGRNPEGLLGEERCGASSRRTVFVRPESRLSRPAPARGTRLTDPITMGPGPRARHPAAPLRRPSAASGGRPSSWATPRYRGARIIAHPGTCGITPVTVNFPLPPWEFARHPGLSRARCHPGISRVAVIPEFCGAVPCHPGAERSQACRTQGPRTERGHAERPAHAQ